MSQTVFKPKALSVSVTTALSVLAGLAATHAGAASTNTLSDAANSNAVRTYSSASATTEFSPGVLRVLESGNDFSSGTNTPKWITLTVNKPSGVDFLNGLLKNASTTSIGVLLNKADAAGASYASVKYSAGFLEVSAGSGAATTYKLASIAGFTSLAKYDLSGADAAANDVEVGRMFAGGKVVLAYAPTGAVNDAFTIALSTMTVTTAGSTSAGDVSITLSDGNVSGTTGLGITGNTVTLASLVNATTNVTESTSGATTVAAAGTTAQQGRGFLITAVQNTNCVNGSSAAALGDCTAGVIEIALTSGGKWFPNLITTGPAANTSNSLLSVNNVSVASISGQGTSTLKLTLGQTATASHVWNSLARIELKNTAFLDSSGVSAGATVQATLSNSGSFKTFTTISKTYDVASAVASGITVAYKDSTTDGVNTFYIGRTGQSVSDGYTATEKALGSIVPSTLFTVSLSNSAKFSANTTPFTAAADSSSGLSSATAGTLTTAASTANATTGSNASSSSAGVLTVSTFNLDLTDATAGDLVVTTNGAGFVSQTATVAKLAAATNTSASGTLPNVVGNSTSTAIADIVITEAAKAALVTTGNKDFIVVLPSGVTFDSTALPTLTVTDSAGATKTNFVTTPVTSDFATANGFDYYKVTLGAGFESTLANSIKISGLKVKASTSAVPGALNVTIGGNNAGVASSDAGAKVYKQTVKVGTVVSQEAAVYPTVTVADQTKAEIVAVPFSPAGKDQGKPGAIFVAVIFQGSVIFIKSDGSFEPYVPGKSPTAYFSGSLGSVNIDALKKGALVAGQDNNITAFKGAQLLFGYGLGISPLGDPFQNMLSNANYNIVFTVQ